MAADTPADPGAFVELYRDHYPRVVAALGLAGADRAGAEDLAQEAFARTYRHWRRVRGGSNPPGYVYTTAFRLLHRRGGLPDLPLEDHDTAAVGPEDAAVVGVDVQHAMGTMPPRRRACAALCLYVGLSPEQAAEALGIEASTVRVQLHRARQSLRRQLGGVGESAAYAVGATSRSTTHSS